MQNIQTCPIHGPTQHTTYVNKVHGRKYEYVRHQCKLCKSERRQAVKMRLIEEMGGKCSRCGYDKSYWALDFHHRDRSQKSGRVNSAATYEKAKKEALKCDLLCANCHREIHHELWVDSQT